MLDLYREVEKRLDCLCFDELWPGFHPYPFSIYASHEAILDGVLMPTPECFYGNTTIQFENRQIAIWNLEFSPPKDLDALTASLVHEMFHAFQMERGDRRFPEDLALLAAPQTPEALAWAIRERQLLAGNAPLIQFCTARLQRRAIESTLEEEKVETAEGMAQYVELLALRNLSAVSFSSALAQCRTRLLDSVQALDLRRRGYDSGSFLLLRAAESGISMIHTVGGEEQTVFELLRGQIGVLPAPEPLTGQAYATAEEILAKQLQQREVELQAFLQLKTQRLAGPFRICGYDPMQMWRTADTLFSRGFLALRDSNGITHSIRGKALLHMAPGDAYQAEDCFVLTSK